MTLKFVFFLVQEYNKILKSSFLCTCSLTSTWYSKYGPEETPSLMTSVSRVWVPPRAVLGSASEELGTVGQKKAGKELWMKELLLRAIKAQPCQGVGALWEMLWNKPGIVSPECRLTVPFTCCHYALDWHCSQRWQCLHTTKLYLMVGRKPPWGWRESSGRGGREMQGEEAVGMLETICLYLVSSEGPRQMSCFISSICHTLLCIYFTLFVYPFIQYLWDAFHWGRSVLNAWKTAVNKTKSSLLWKFYSSGEDRC